MSLMKRFAPLFSFLMLLSFVLWQPVSSPAQVPTESKRPFVWENANIYFLLTDRFNNGDPSNDRQFDRNENAAPLRGFMGGDLKGITQKIQDGYFDRLGISAIWISPVVEQIHGGVDEGTGKTYGFHGYWARDWTRIDPNYGTADDLGELVETAHRHGIRIVMDVVLNHTGPVTPEDPAWPEEWVRTSPTCTYQNYETTVTCTLVRNLPDVRTDRNEPVQLPEFLVEKWKNEGRLEQEQQELNTFFEKTGYPRAPRYYLIKWLTDYIRDFGIDGYRIDTAKHTEAYVWDELRKEADRAFGEWKQAHPGQVLDNASFYMVGEVYNYNIAGGLNFNYGDKQVDFFHHGMNSLINFGFKSDAHASYRELFSRYEKLLHGPLQGYGVLNYIDSHDDGHPFDRNREQPMEAGTKLLLTPGAAQIYYGDESARSLNIARAEGDAKLRSFMNWDELKNNAERNGYSVDHVLAHYQKLGQFRHDHPAVGAGIQKLISDSPYIFSRTYTQKGYNDQVVVGLNLNPGSKTIPVKGLFEDGTRLKDYYSGQEVTVEDGKTNVHSDFTIVLLGTDPS